MTTEPEPAQPRLTHKQAVQRVAADQEIAARLQRLPAIADKRQRYAYSGSGLLAELADLGYRVERVSQLSQLEDFSTAVPVLLSWLPRVTDLSLAVDIARTLSVRATAKQAFPVFLELFRDPPAVEDPDRPASSEPAGEFLRWILGNGLAEFARPEFTDELIELAANRRYGAKRALIVRALPKTKDDRVPGILMTLLDDPTVEAFAIEALGKMRYASARDQIAAKLDHPDKDVRDQVKKALKRLD